MIWYFVEDYSAFCDLCNRIKLNRFDFHITEDLHGSHNTKYIHYKERITISIAHLDW